MLPVKRGRGRPPKFSSSSAPNSPNPSSPVPNGYTENGKHKKFKYKRFITGDSPADEVCMFRIHHFHRHHHHHHYHHHHHLPFSVWMLCSNNDLIPHILVWHCICKILPVNLRNPWDQLYGIVIKFLVWTGPLPHYPSSCELLYRRTYMWLTKFFIVYRIVRYSVLLRFYFYCFNAR